MRQVAHSWSNSQIALTLFPFFMGGGFPTLREFPFGGATFVGWTYEEPGADP